MSDVKNLSRKIIQIQWNHPGFQEIYENKAELTEP